MNHLGGRGLKKEWAVGGWVLQIQITFQLVAQLAVPNPIPFRFPIPIFGVGVFQTGWRLLIRRMGHPFGVCVLCLDFPLSVFGPESFQFSAFHVQDSWHMCVSGILRVSTASEIN